MLVTTLILFAVDFELITGLSVGKFPVDNIQDIQFIPGVMQKLVIDKDEKDLIIAFLNNDSSSIAFDDFIPGKGERQMTEQLIEN